MASSLALNLQARGNSVHVVCLREAGATPISVDRFRGAAVALVELRTPEGMHPETLRRLVQYMREYQIQVVHTHNPLVHHYGILAGRLSGVPVVVNTLHGIQTLRMARWAEMVFRACFLGTDRVVAVCPAVRDAFCNLFGPAQKTIVIRNGIELEELLSIRPRRADGYFVFGTMGRLSPVKDQQTLLEAFAVVYGSYPQCRLEILGDGELRQTLEERAIKLGVSGAVLFRGWSTDIAAFLSRLDAFVLSSVSEGLPLTILEAMAAGLPIIATAVGGVPEVVSGAGCGWLCPPSDPAALAAAMICGMNAEDRSVKSANGRQAVQTHYSADGMAEQYLKLFKNLLDGRVGTSV